MSSSAAAKAMSTTVQRNEDDWLAFWMPLILSLLAGLSTCLGASVVFCATTTKRSKKQQDTPQSPLSHHHMSFSLALAGSVMVTVSFYSLLPESYTDDTPEEAMLSIDQQLFWERTVGFLLGCGIYWLLSKCAFPEPEELIAAGTATTDHTNENGTSTDEEAQALLTTPALSFRSDEDDGAIEAPAGGGGEKNSHHRHQKQQIRSRASVPSTPPRAGKRIVLPPEGLSPVRHSNSSLSSAASVVENSDNTQSNDDDSSQRKASKKRRSGTNGGGVSCLQSWTAYSAGRDLGSHEARRAWRAAMILFVSLAVHNFPEGFAVAASTMHSPKLGVTTAVAIAFHNIPEGIAIAIPSLAARPDSPCLAFWLASISGLVEPLGATVALFFLRRIPEKEEEQSAMNMKNVLAFVAGVMVMVAINELFPEAARHSRKAKTPFVAGIVSGAVIMIASDSVLEA